MTGHGRERERDDAVQRPPSACLVGWCCCLGPPLFLESMCFVCVFVPFLMLCCFVLFCGSSRTKTTNIMTTQAVPNYFGTDAWSAKVRSIDRSTHISDPRLSWTPSGTAPPLRLVWMDLSTNTKCLPLHRSQLSPQPPDIPPTRRPLHLEGCPRRVNAARR